MPHAQLLFGCGDDGEVTGQPRHDEPHDPPEPVEGPPDAFAVVEPVRERLDPGVPVRLGVGRETRSQAVTVVSATPPPAALEPAVALLGGQPAAAIFRAVRWSWAGLRSTAISSAAPSAARASGMSPAAATTSTRSPGCDREGRQVDPVVFPGPGEHDPAHAISRKTVARLPPAARSARRPRGRGSSGRARQLALERGAHRVREGRSRSRPGHDLEVGARRACAARTDRRPRPSRRHRSGRGSTHRAGSPPRASGRRPDERRRSPGRPGRRAAALPAARTVVEADPGEIALPVAHEGHRPVVELGADDLADAVGRLTVGTQDLRVDDVLVEVIALLGALAGDPPELLAAVLVADRAAEERPPSRRAPPGSRAPSPPRRRAASGRASGRSRPRRGRAAPTGTWRGAGA